MHDQILTFWFNELTPGQWFKKDPVLDELIKSRFGPLHHQAQHGELFNWRETPEGSLAEIIILDQFSRNIYRDKAESFASDALALCLAQVAIEKGFDVLLSKAKRSFCYMPFMHSESLVIHEQAVVLFNALGDENNLTFERKHQAIIQRFGRYPHRNNVLGRQSTLEERDFLNQPDSSF